MSRPAFLCSVVLAVILAAAATPALSCATPGNLDEVRQETLRAINAQRRAAGLRPLQVDNRLTRAAQGHACDSAKHNHMSHVSSDGTRLSTRIKRTGYTYSEAGENVGYGFRSPPSAVNWWMNSPGHRATILNSRLREIGIGFAYASDNTPHWVMDAAAPR